MSLNPLRSPRSSLRRTTRSSSPVTASLTTRSLSGNIPHSPKWPSSKVSPSAPCQDSVSMVVYLYLDLFIYSFIFRPPGNEGRILNMSLSPDGSTLAAISSDETIRLWRCFEKDPSKKGKPVSSSIVQQHIR